MARRHRLVLGAVLAVGIAPALGGCGFTPLYAAPGVSGGLPAIAVVAPQGRVPYLIREELDDALGRNTSVPPIWRLEITTVQTRDPRGLRLDNVAERYDLGLTVKYVLTSIATGKVAHTGEVSTEVSYDAANAPYAGISARQDSQARVAADAARRIQIELAAWMAAHPAG
jgi:LPS-assembly lipoprotein